MGRRLRVGHFVKLYEYSALYFLGCATEICSVIGHGLSVEPCRMVKKKIYMRDRGWGVCRLAEHLGLRKAELHLARSHAASPGEDL